MRVSGLRLRLRGSCDELANSILEVRKFQRTSASEVFAPVDVRKSQSRGRGGEFGAKRIRLAIRTSLERFIHHAMLAGAPCVRYKFIQKFAPLGRQIPGITEGPKYVALQSKGLIHFKLEPPSLIMAAHRTGAGTIVFVKHERRRKNLRRVGADWVAKPVN